MDRDGEGALDVIPDVAGADAAVVAPVTRIDVSSTRIREIVAAGGRIDDLVPPGVLAVIEREGLYRTGS